MSKKDTIMCVYNSLVGVNVTVEHTHEGGGGGRSSQWITTSPVTVWMTHRGTLVAAAAAVAAVQRTRHDR